jgi:hypothetical protein
MRRRRSYRRANGDHGPLRWSLLLNHRWHRLRLPLGLHDILRDSFGGLGLTDRSRPGSRPDNRICGSRTRRRGRAGGSGPGQKGSKRMKKRGKKKGGRAEQTEVSKHPCRDVWPTGWSHSEPQTSWPQPLAMPGWGPASPRLLLRPQQLLPSLRPPPRPSPPQPSLPRPLLQRLVLIGRYLIVIKDDARLFALVEGRGAGTAGGAPLTAYWDASMVVTASGATRTVGPGDDHAAGWVAPLHGSNVNIVQRGYYRQQRCPRRLVRAKGCLETSVASRVSPRLDPGPRSSRMMSFTPVYIHVGWWDWS